MAEQRQKVSVKADRADVESLALAKATHKYPDSQGIASVWKVTAVVAMTAPEGFESLFPADMSGLWIVDVSRSLDER